MELSGVLGLTFAKAEVQLDPAPYIALAKESGISISGDAKPASYYIDRLIEKRIEARKTKNWALGDNIRKSLAANGITLEDTSQGTTWKYKK
jgi:cysteinyl-tRNA synthetase